MIIDFHSHYFPKPYLKQLQAGGPYLRRLPRPISRELWDIDARRRDGKRMIVDLEVLSLSNPMIDFVSPKKAPILARIVNDDIAETVAKNERRFVGIASLPFTNMPFVLEEMERAINELGLKGVSICSNVAGRSLNEPEFHFFWRRVSDLDIPVLIHPTDPFGMEWGKMQEHGLTFLVGFPFETTLAVSKLILSGILEDNPNLKIFAPHCGGAIPYLIGRLDTGYSSFPIVREDIPKPPSSYLKNIYLDCASFLDSALRLAHKLLSTDNMLFGTDYPYKLGTTANLLQAIKELAIGKEKENKILSENAKRLLKL